MHEVMEQQRRPRWSFVPTQPSVVEQWSHCFSLLSRRIMMYEGHACVFLCILRLRTFWKKHGAKGCNVFLHMLSWPKMCHNTVFLLAFFDKCWLCSLKSLTFYSYTLRCEMLFREPVSSFITWEILSLLSIQLSVAQYAKNIYKKNTFQLLIAQKIQ